MNSILIQFVGLLAWFIVTISYWQKKKIYLVILELVAYILYALHFFMLDAMSGMACNLVAIIVLFNILIKEKINKPCYYLIPGILIMYGLLIVFTYENIYSLFPVIAGIISVAPKWSNNMKLIKISALISSTLWIVYSIFFGSYAVIITNIIFIISTTISLLKMEKRKN